MFLYTEYYRLLLRTVHTFKHCRNMTDHHETNSFSIGTLNIWLEVKKQTHKQHWRPVSRPSVQHLSQIRSTSPDPPLTSIHTHDWKRADGVQEQSTNSSYRWEQDRSLNSGVFCLFVFVYRDSALCVNFCFCVNFWPKLKARILSSSVLPPLHHSPWTFWTYLWTFCIWEWAVRCCFPILKC